MVHVLIARPRVSRKRGSLLTGAAQRARRLFGFATPAVATAVLTGLIVMGAARPSMAYNWTREYFDPSNQAYGAKDYNWGVYLDLGTLNAWNITEDVNGISGSTVLDTLDNQITNDPKWLSSGNYLEWSIGILARDKGNFAYNNPNTASINIPANTTVQAIYDGNGWGHAAGIYADYWNGPSGAPVIGVENYGNVTGTVNNNDGVGVGVIGFTNYGDVHINNHSKAYMAGEANWFGEGIRTRPNNGSVFSQNDGTLYGHARGGHQDVYNNQGWACGYDLQTYTGNITVTNTGTSTGTVEGVNYGGSSEACGGYIWANDSNTGTRGPGDANGNLTFNNYGTFTANGARGGAVKGCYAGGNGDHVNINNYGNIIGNTQDGGGAYGWGLGAEIDARGTMNLYNSGNILCNGPASDTIGLQLVSTYSGATGSTRVENSQTGKIEGHTGIDAYSWTGPITIHNHGTINGTGSVYNNPPAAISLGNTTADTINIYGNPTITGRMVVQPAGSKLYMHIPALLTYSSSGRYDTNLANDNLTWDQYHDAVITAGGKTYSWNNLTVSGYTADVSFPNGVYKIVNRNSGKVLDNYNWMKQDGSQVVQWDDNAANQANQQWRLTYEGNGAYEIRNIYGDRDLDLNGWNTADGAKIDLWTVGGTPGANCQWIFTQTDNGWYTISNAYIPGSCVDIPYASKDRQVGIQLYHLANTDDWPNGGWGQQWQLVRLY